MNIKYLFFPIFFASCGAESPEKKSDALDEYSEHHRPQVHFSPRQKWMNDPNGMVFYNETYHLFYQHYPDSSIWGPMHWGHATSHDLVHWQHQPIALFPDSLGYIFSGSAVLDKNNTSGFGTNDQAPLVAIFTHHDPQAEKQGKIDYQNQSIAYSLDSGKTWTKYSGNPVVKNPGIKDFRDPKIMWHEQSDKWIMTLATLDHITFYSSPNLKNWTKESTFGKEVGAHGGVWECPDLLAFDDNGKPVWVLLVSINPGGPNGGSATQYFTGDFDGKTFTPYQTDIRWIDYGPDNYAGVIWSNTGDRKVFLGWMNNWQYANIVPTKKWRGAATLPRDLSIQRIEDKYFVRSQIVKELSAIEGTPSNLNDVDARNLNLAEKPGKLAIPARLTIKSEKLEPFTIAFSNDKGEKLMIGYDAKEDSFFIDRTNSGEVSFEKGFAARHKVPRLTNTEAFDLTLVIDNASVELFADQGLSVMTEIFFPTSPFSNLHISSTNDFKIRSLQYIPMKSIWTGE